MIHLHFLSCRPDDGVMHHVVAGKMTFRLLLAGLTAVGLSVAFSPQATFMSTPRQTRSVRLYMSATQESKEELMNSVDEEVLFGESSSAGGQVVNGAAQKEKLPPFEPARHRHMSKTGNLLEATNMPLNPLDHSPNDPLINALKGMREGVTSCPALWSDLAKLCGDRRALLDKHSCDTKMDLTYGQMDDTVRRSASVFQKLGVDKKGVNVAVFGENSAMWLIVDHGIQLAGGATAVRGADAPVEELRYIYEHSDSRGVVVLQNARLLQRLASDAKKDGLGGLGLRNDLHGPVKTVILMHRGKTTDEEIAEMTSSLGGDVKVRVFSDMLDVAKPVLSGTVPKIGREDLATIVYTSGTTGSPKGVMLTHGNLLHQMGHRLAPTKLYDESEPLPGELMLALLPVWHITERTFELWMLSRGCSVVYSSIRTFKNDLAEHQPQWLVLVPRVLEKVCLGVLAKFSSGSTAVKALSKFFTTTGSARATNEKIARGLVVGDMTASAVERTLSKGVVASLAPINAVGDKLVWSKVKEGFGGRIKAIISGGSALPGSLESFYETCGITILVGYGLTECSPLISHRRSDANLVTAGCVGQPCMDTEVRIVDPENKPDFGERQPLPDGEIGVVVARGPQVMKGYYKNPDATDKTIDRFGWFDTGDLGKVNPATGDIILTGRCKDTIVLSNGENIEPSPIEDAILTESALIEQIMLTGQDGRRLVAIAVLNPGELVNAGYLDADEGKKLTKVYDKVNDPKCSEEDYRNAATVLQDASDELRSNSALKGALEKDIKKATAGFRKWEQVGDVYSTAEPFAMINGLLTQSYKVKRNEVMKRYDTEMSNK